MMGLIAELEASDLEPSKREAIVDLLHRGGPRAGIDVDTSS